MATRVTCSGTFRPVHFGLAGRLVLCNGSDFVFSMHLWILLPALVLPEFLDPFRLHFRNPIDLGDLGPVTNGVEH
jgi:hypothetical protein